MKDHDDSGGKILVIDDTIFAGTAIRDIKKKIKEDAFYATVYAHPDSTQKLDFYGKVLPPPHFLEWNLFNCVYIESALLDFDGILCPNVPYSKCINEEEYTEYIKNVEPFYHRIPKTRCRGIVTARLEKIPRHNRGMARQAWNKIWFFRNVSNRKRGNSRQKSYTGSSQF